MLGKFLLLLPLLQPNLYFFLIPHWNLPKKRWISANSVSCVGICQGQHSPGFFLIGLSRFAGSTVSKACTEVCVLLSDVLVGKTSLGSPGVGARFYNGSFVRGWVSNSLFKKEECLMLLLFSYATMIPFR